MFPVLFLVLPATCKNLAIRDFHAHLYQHRFGFVDVGRDPERTKISILRFIAPKKESRARHHSRLGLHSWGAADRQRRGPLGFEQ